MKKRAWSFKIDVSKTCSTTGLYSNFETYSLLVRRDLTWGNYQMFKDKIIEAFSLLGYKSVVVFGSKTKIPADEKNTLIAYDEIIEYFANLVKKNENQPDTAKPKEPETKMKCMNLIPDKGFSSVPRPAPETYKPKRGRLTIGTQLEVDWDNPTNWGRSGIPGTYTVLDILDQTTMSKAYNKTTTEKYYILIFKPDTPWSEDNIYSKPMAPMTADEIFAWLRIIKRTQPKPKE